MKNVNRLKATMRKFGKSIVLTLQEQAKNCPRETKF